MFIFMFVASAMLMQLSSAYVPIIITARITCDNVPVANLTVDFWDDDTFTSDDYLGSRLTNANGTAVGDFAQKDGLLDNHLEPYLIVDKFMCRDVMTTCEKFSYPDNDVSNDFSRHTFFHVNFPVSSCETNRIKRSAGENGNDNGGKVKISDGVVLL